MMTSRHLLPALAAALVPATAALAADLAGSVLPALPLPEGKPPVIDGDLSDWDLSGAESCWIADELADRQYATVYFMYDDDALYFAADMGLLDHDITNDNRAQDRFWAGDCLQLRLCTDPPIPYPLPDKHGHPPCYEGNDRVTGANFWRNTADGGAEDILYIQPGAFFDLPCSQNPPGSAVAIVPRPRAFTLESRIPWGAVGVPDGRNPFRPGEEMAAVLDVKWHPGGDGRMAVLMYRADPGAFAFLNLGTWGRLRFEAAGNLPRRHATPAEVAAAARAAGGADHSGETAVTFDLPEKAFVSVNIVDEAGGVIRELMGGEEHGAGPVTAWWDGRDARGFPVEAGRDYRWAAYAHPGKLDVEFFGAVGTEGDPPYETRDGKGAWGGDHGPSFCCATDATGRYWVWRSNESGRGIVKTDFDGKVLWRTAPFVLGGWGEYSAACAGGGKLYLVHETDFDKGHAAHLVRLDASTGLFELFPDGTGAVPIGLAPAGASDFPDGTVPLSCVGMAVLEGTVYVSDFPGKRLLALDGATGARLRELPCPVSPRGLCPDGRGRILVAGLVPEGDRGAIVALDPATGAAMTLVSAPGVLRSPFGVAIDGDGNLHATDLGDSQQVKTFAPVPDPPAGGDTHALARVLGREGGRPPLGAYDPASFSEPRGIACGPDGVLLVAEASSPKVQTLLDAATGATLRKMFGFTSYSTSTIPDTDDPLLQYYSLSGPASFARARIPDGGGIGRPEASWDFPAAGLGAYGPVMTTMEMPEVVRMTNGVKLFAADGGNDRLPGRPRPILRVGGDGSLAPVACVRSQPREDGATDVRALELWSDADGDGAEQSDEVSRAGEIAGRGFDWAVQTGSLHLEPDGTLYLVTMNNAIVAVPATGFHPSGAPAWDLAAARVAVPEVVEGVGPRLHSGWRAGILGVRLDAGGNLYAAVNCDPPYATPELARRMHGGMGHTADSAATLLLKFAPGGRRLWSVGRKALASPRPGEILHHWVFAGMVGDYPVCASEWGLFTIYTSDGFYAGRLFDLPGDEHGRGIPYCFGGEDFSGRIQFFPERGEVWAYNSGFTFRVSGFDAAGRIPGERRFGGTVRLGSVKPAENGGQGAAKPFAAAVRDAAPASDADWDAVPETAMDGDCRATFRLCLADGALHLRAHVPDATPLVNAAASPNAVFKGGDAVGFEIGPAGLPGKAEPRKAYPGTARVLAARVGGRDIAVGFKPFAALGKSPQDYATPAGGTAAFEFAGEIPGAVVRFETDADGRGYTAWLSVPAAFLELPEAPAEGVEFAGDFQVLLSGEGGRGLGTIARHYLFNPPSGQTTMVDDTPTEARLYPAGWGSIVFGR